jgi:hypothetical protein
VVGKVKDGETDDEALVREAEEEIGWDAADAAFIFVHVRNRPCLVDYSGHDEKVIIYGDFLEECDFLQLIKLESSTSGIRLITQQELDSVRVIGQAEKEIGMSQRPRNEIGMTPDVLTAFRAAFARYGK